jgi:DegV family protein with EDD domain
MISTCILTDSTALFPPTSHNGQGVVRVIPFSIDTKNGARLIAPSVADLISIYRQLEREFDAICVLTLSEQLSPLNLNAQQAAIAYGGSAHVTVVDSHNTGAGLGALARLAAESAATGIPLTELERRVRAAIPRVYSLFCIPDLTQLAHIGLISPAQAAAGEILGLQTMFVLEDGRFAPFGKVRTQRHLVESFQEFVEEFTDAEQIALTKGSQARIRAKPLRQCIADLFPQTPFNEFLFNPALSALIGSQSAGLVVVEKSK